ncbi:Holliday junction resolvase RuvX [Helicobacter sp. 16-1353]|uniref:Holliday junction resolvase RuvX n=1 Tax=Helicobacter sp. 16-1353 TaxID=2004996 RepID=UPI000DCC0D5B|nr:Holliday junction resolvase RuvX [Helicobacter sp. 16-1353]RAX55342.1 Holliday junction resolvase RuvX [Helicobacter sp. 16-1353]
MIAIDFGLKRIGIAQNCNGVIIPLKPIIRKNRNQAANDLDKILYEKNTKILVIGVANDEMQSRIKHFTTLLKFKGEIVFVDENLTSQEAENLINNRDNSHTLRKNGVIDSLSAMIIMQRYLDKSK